MFDGNKCGKCQNHDHEVFKKGHARDCPFKRCECLKCCLLDARSDILQVISGKETKLKGTKKDPNCGFCQNHGIKILRKGHVRSCGFGQERHFKLENCFDCEVHYIRNEVNRLQIKMRRAMKEDRMLSEEQRKTAREPITRDEVERVCEMARLARKKRETILATQQVGESSSSHHDHDHSSSNQQQHNHSHKLAHRAPLHIKHSAGGAGAGRHAASGANRRNPQPASRGNQVAMARAMAQQKQLHLQQQQQQQHLQLQLPSPGVNLANLGPSGSSADTRQANVWRPWSQQQLQHHQYQQSHLPQPLQLQHDHHQHHQQYDDQHQNQLHNEHHHHHQLYHQNPARSSPYQQQQHEQLEQTQPQAQVKSEPLELVVADNQVQQQQLFNAIFSLLYAQLVENSRQQQQPQPQMPPAPPTGGDH